MFYVIDRKWHRTSIHQSISQSILENKHFKRHNTLLLTLLCNVVCYYFYPILRWFKKSSFECHHCDWGTKILNISDDIVWAPDGKAFWLESQLHWSLLVLKQPWGKVGYLYLEVCLMGWREAELPLHGLLTITISISLGWETATRDRLWWDC